MLGFFSLRGKRNVFKVTAIDELQQGSCSLAIEDPCTAQSKHRVLITNPTHIGDPNIDVLDYTYGISGAGNTMDVVGNVFTMHLESPTDSEFHPFARLTGAHTTGKLYEIHVLLEVSGGQMFMQSIGYSDKNGDDVEDIYNMLLDPGTYEFIIYGNFRTNNLINFVGNGQTFFNFDAVATLTMTEVDLSYVWSTTAAIVQGQNTETVFVETTGTTDSTFDLTCQVTDNAAAKIVNKTVSVTHTRTA